MKDVVEQASLGLCYYIGLLILVRMGGKRLAGQTTTFDLIVLISLGVVLQTELLRDGTLNAVTFVVTVFAAHKSLATLCAKYTWLRHLIRGAPRKLIHNGKILTANLVREGISKDELFAGLRKLGFASIDSIKVAVLEETGHISAIPFTPSEEPGR